MALREKKLNTCDGWEDELIEEAVNVNDVAAEELQTVRHKGCPRGAG